MTWDEEKVMRLSSRFLQVGNMVDSVVAQGSVMKSHDRCVMLGRGGFTHHWPDCKASHSCYVQCKIRVFRGIKAWLSYLGAWVCKSIPICMFFA